MMEPGMGPGFELDGGFEPQTRARSNTWPCPRPESFPDGAKEAGGESGTPPQPAAGLLPVKKNSSRRNAWGNLSYADLITQAITSAPDKRLTLSQIYEWMVQNVPYFKDKGDSNSSAGWKNSIRHNLSLHNRFMRVQNEGTGKSSWWMINPDAKPGKSARRRATSMETSKFEKRRGRVKKKVEALRNGSLQADATPSPSSSVSEGLDLFPDSPIHPASSFQLSPDFRPRASSNASSCGRLSPIPAVIGEPDWTPSYASTYSPEQLAGSLAETMKLVPTYQMYQTSPSSQQQQPPQPQSQQQQQQSGPPPSYFEAQYQRNNASRSGSSPFGLPPTPTAQSQRCPVHLLQSCTCQLQNANLVSNMSPSYQMQNEPSPPMTAQQQSIQQYLMQQQQQADQQTTQMQPQQQAVTLQSQQQASNDPSPDSPIPRTVMGQLIGALNHPTILDDLNINIEHIERFRDEIDLPDCDFDDVVINGTIGLSDNTDLMLECGLTGGNGNTSPNIPALDQLTDSVTSQHQATTATSNMAGVAGMASNAASAAAVYASTNAATPAASPSWVH